MQRCFGRIGHLEQVWVAGGGRLGGRTSACNGIGHMGWGTNDGVHSIAGRAGIAEGAYGTHHDMFCELV